MEGDDPSAGRSPAARLPPAGSELPQAVLEQLFFGAPVGFAVFDADRRLTTANPALVRMWDLADGDGPSGRRIEVAVPEIAAPVAAAVEQVLQTSLPVESVELDAPGDRHYVSSYAPFEDGDGSPQGVVALVHDVSQRKRADLALGRALNRMTRLQRITAALSAALTVGQVADAVLQESVEAIGASCGVMGVVGERGLEVTNRVGMAGRPPSVIPLEAAAPMPEAVRRRAAVVVESRDRWDAEYDSPPGSDFESFIAVPLVFEGRARACMGLGLPLPGAPDDQDLSLLNAIARQGAQAVERARLFDERAAIAQTLQRGLLPRRIPAIGWLDLAVRYRPAGGGSEVGGDFYDVLELDGGWCLAVVGDVCGKGARAAVHSGMLRTTIAAMSLHANSPAEILDLTNRALMRRGQSWPYATVACAALNFSQGRIECDVASAGHPPALLRSADGGLRELDAEGLMIGVQGQLRLRSASLTLHAGEALVLYTDGMVDARADGERFGEQRLGEAVASAPSEGAEALAEHLALAVSAFETGPPRDDRALLVVCPAQSPSSAA